MLSIRLPLAIFVTIILSIVAYFVTQSLSTSPIGPFLPSIFVILLFVFLLIPTIIAKTPASSSTQRTNKPTSRKNESTSRPSPSLDGVTTLYVGNLPYKANEITVKELFEQTGSVTSVRLMKDRKTNRRKGFGFVEVDANQADEMIAKLNDSEFMDRTIKVRPAKDKA
ncbi:RNA recognition motif domain-containing protein [Glaciecola siphonariae]|uniref:RNA recognition motif domain-containing protein n=1 Tax=Glaciecola siphonariae TaxID=521012 RepID=A0ABV9M1Z4_9ALTE